MNLARVEFTFSDGTVVTFQPSKTQWVSWSARVVTRQDRREKRVSGSFFTNDHLQPTLLHAQRLTKRAGELRAAECQAAGVEA